MQFPKWELPLVHETSRIGREVWNWTNCAKFVLHAQNLGKTEEYFKAWAKELCKQYVAKKLIEEENANLNNTWAWVETLKTALTMQEYCVKFGKLGFKRHHKTTLEALGLKFPKALPLPPKQEKRS